MQTYHGRRHRGTVVFEVETDPTGAMIHNFSICRRRAAMMHKIPAAQFRPVQGEHNLALYQFNTNAARHYFRKTCGIYPFHRPRIAPKDMTVNAGYLGGLDGDAIAALEIKRFDGQNFSIAGEN